MTTDSQNACKVCNKSHYALLLLRPSPVPKPGTPGLVPAEVHDVDSADAYINGLVPDRRPTESRYVLRLLREGYVYIHIPNPPCFMSNWLVYRVAANGDVITEDNAAFNQSPYKACSRKGHNASGMKLIEIPDAETLIGQTLWVAYSANRWNAKQYAQNAANPKAMTPIKLACANPNGFQPTEDALTRHVLECKLPSLRFTEAKAEPDFPFTSQVATVADLAENLRAAAACHPDTQGKEQAIVLPDPAGVAAELNALRLFRYELAKAEVAKPENAHPLASIQMLEGLRLSVVDSYKTDAVSPYMNKWAFETIMYKNGNPREWPEGTRWEPVSDPRLIEEYGRGIGQLVFPDQAEREAQWVAWAHADGRYWAKYRKYIDEPAIESWREKFESMMLTKHGQPQARFETDWWAACQDQRFKNYFALHFDDQHPNGPMESPNPGSLYQEEVVRSLTPQPHAAGVLPEQYVAELEKDITQPDAQLLRALVANQADLFPGVSAYLSDDRQDKLHDLGAGLFTGLKQHLDVADIKYGWLVHAGFIGYSMAITQSLAAAVTAVTATGAIPPQTRIDLVRRSMMISQTLLMARESAVNRSWLKTPVRVSVTLPLEDAKRLMTQRRSTIRAGAEAANTDAARTAAQQQINDLPSNTRLKKLAKQRGGNVTLTLLSDNHELAAMDQDPRKAIGSGAGEVGMGSRAPAATTAATLVVTEQQFAKLLAQQPQRIKLAADAMRELAHFGKGMTLSLPGHIGLLTLTINGWAGVENLARYRESGDALAFWSTVDSGMSIIAGTAQLTEAGLSASITHRLGAQAAARALSVLGARVVTAGAGAAAGVAVTVGQFVKAQRAYAAGNDGAAIGYAASGFTAAGFTTASAIETLGLASNFMITRGSKAAMWQAGKMVADAAARRVAISIGGRIVLGLTGWGLILLGASLIFEVVAILLTPNKLQKHIEKTYFGTGSDRYGTLDEEVEALDALIAKNVDQNADLAPIQNESVHPPSPKTS